MESFWIHPFQDMRSLMFFFIKKLRINSFSSEAANPDRTRSMQSARIEGRAAPDNIWNGPTFKTSVLII